MTVHYDPFDAEVRANPLPIYRRLRDEAPVYYMERYDAWAISRFQDIWDLSSSNELSAARGSAPAQLLTKDQPVSAMINNMDPPDHTVLRAAIRKCFLPKNVRAVEPLARQLASEFLDEVGDRAAFDAIGDFSARLSVTVACTAIGLPVEDGPMLTKLVQRFFPHDPDAEGMTEEGLAALNELNAYCGDMAKARRKANPDSSDAIDAVVRFQPGGKSLSDEDMASHVTMLVIGGSETFPKVFASGLVRLLEHPDQRARLAADPSKVDDAFNEILRYDMPTQFLGRTVVSDQDVHGRTLRAGQPVIFLYASANRDEREFESPDVFDIDRKPARILSFGAGNHACLGTHVARMEGRVCFQTILERYPEYELDLDHAVRLKTEFVQGFASLPVRIR